MVGTGERMVLAYEYKYWYRVTFYYDTVHYEDSELRALIEQLKSVHNLINSTIPSQVSALGQKESLWSGETKEKYLGL